MKKAVYILLIVMLSNSVFAQFYNGLQTDFGKNRVQYDSFMWQYYRFKKFDTFYYTNGKEIAEYTAEFAENKIKEFEAMFEFALQRRIIFIVYNNLSDFRQSNIGLVSGVNQYNIGGVTKISNNKAFLYYEGDKKHLEKQITAAIAEIFLNEMIFGTSFTARMANSTLITFPEWYIKGLVSYLSEPWSVEIDNKVKDGILNGDYEKFNRLSGDDAVYAGHSIWNYIVNRYGIKVIPNIIYLAKISKNMDSGFMFVLGTNLKYLSYDWLNYYEDIYAKDEKNRTEPLAENEIKKKTRKPRVFDQIEISHDGKFYAYTSNQEGQYRIRFFDTETGKTKKILKREHKLVQITDYSYPLIEWHPSGEFITYIIEEKGGIWFYMYNLETKKIDKRRFFGYDKILDYSISNDGKKIVFSAVKEGQTDIYLFSLAANGAKQLTNDRAEDMHPSFTKNDDGVVFSSNRQNEELIIGDTLIQENYDIFQLNIIDAKRKMFSLTQITFTQDENETQAHEISNHKYIYLNDKNGINNKYVAKFDSSIAFIDTITHYKYNSISSPITNYKRSILSHDYNVKTKDVGEILFNNDKYNLYKYKLEKPSFTNKELEPSYYIKNKIRIKEYNDSLVIAEQIKQDSLLKVLQNDTLPPKIETDTLNIDINNYKFDISVEQAKLRGKLKSNDEIEAEEKKQDKAEERRNSVMPRLYFTNFFINDMVTQIDFSFLNNSYQAFTGYGYFYNPGFNVFFKLGAMDLFEDYKVTGAFRFAGNFDSNEWLVSIENLKKRVDKQVVFHRRVFNDYYGDYFTKTQSHTLNYITKYPFSQVSAARLTLGARSDRTAVLSTDSRSLLMDDMYKNWVNLKLEYIFDNSRDLGVNLYSGNRAKVFFEAYKQVDQAKTDMFVVGIDLRHYEKIHRTLIFATRFAASSSFGQSKLMYYMGGVDNWMNFSSKTPTFDPSNQIDYSQNWAFQTIATNMRGFSQNIRNGSNFLVLNNELRWPMIRYFANRPVNSDFLNSFQVIGFFDAGTAWTGLSPYSEYNKYNIDIIPNDQQGPIILVIEKDKDPLVYGYGFGFRARLLGYFIRADWAWGIKDQIIQPSVFYLSLSLDF